MLYCRKWEEALLDDTCSLLASELKLAPGTPGGMEAYRLALCLSFFCKTFVSIHESLLTRGVSVVFISRFNTNYKLVQVNTFAMKLAIWLLTV